MKIAAKKNVLISPLCWGLGHAARCIPLIHEFQKQECKISVFANKEITSYYKSRFPDIEYYEDSLSCIEYGLKGFSYSRMIQTAFNIFFRYKKEQNAIKRIIKKHHFDILISDNRYGVWHHKTKNILITHQLQIILPGVLKILQKRVNNYIFKKNKKFDQIWIPDMKNFSLCGKLAEQSIENKLNTKRIGMLSRFNKTDTELIDKTDYCLILCSGPSPHRKQMTNFFIKELRNTSQKIKIIGSTDKSDIPNNIEIIEKPEDKEFQKLIEDSSCIISRAGYSTIMDLIQLGKSAILVPTPGQSEQEYLSLRLKEFFVYAPTLQQAAHFIKIHIGKLEAQKLEAESYIKEEIKSILHFN